MDVVVVGMNHRTAPVDVRERLDFSKQSAEDYLRHLADRQGIQSGLVLSTCNRVEIYAAGNAVEDLIGGATDFLRHFHPLQEVELRQLIYNKSNRDAVRHLFRVASSLDSMVVGEPQILGQVKEAYFASKAAALTDPFLDRLLMKTFQVAKKIRTETGIAQQAVSVSYAAVELAKQIFGELEGKSVLILGAGEMAELAARHLKKQKLKRLVFANRSYDHSVELARAYGGIPIPLSDFTEYLPESDIVLVSTAAPYFLVTHHQVEAVMEHRRQTPMFFIDISVPRNVEPSIHEIEDVYLYNIDDLQNVVAKNSDTRGKEAEKAEALVEAEVEKFFTMLEGLRVVPVIQKLQSRAEELTSAELARLLSRLEGLSEAQKGEIQRSMQSLSTRLLNPPILYLKDSHDEEDPLLRADRLRKIFALGTDDDADTDGEGES